MAYKNHQPEFWREHLQRLRTGCERLSLTPVDDSLWLADIEKCRLKNDAVIKLVVTRGVTERGYAFDKHNAVTRVIITSAMPKYPESYQQGVNARLCKTPVSVNTALAGIKHLNRLDNVLARNEWHDPNIAEGFMFDNKDNLIEGTMSNVFCIHDNQLYTPDLTQCGVAGVMRERIINIAKSMNVIVNMVDIKRQDFLTMDAIFITNSLIEFQKNALINRLQDKLYSDKI